MDIAELHARYVPHAQDFTIDLNPLVEASSPSARAFFVLANLGAGTELTVQSLYRSRWADNPLIISSFKRLDPAAQQDVLTLYTLPIHEMRHHIDFTITTFGAIFYASLGYEYANFQELSPWLVRRPELSLPGNLRRLQERLDSLGWTYLPTTAPSGATGPDSRTL